MMTVRLRIAAMLVGHALFGRRAAPVPRTRLALRCWPTDCDINLHMNNSRYLALMDLGRWHYLLATGLATAVWRRRWAPVAVRAEIDFKRSLRPGERFELETFAIAASARSVTIAQRFWRGDTLCADARIVVLFMHAGKPQALAPLFEEVPTGAPLPEPASGEPAPCEPAQVA